MKPELSLEWFFGFIGWQAKKIFHRLDDDIKKLKFDVKHFGIFCRVDWFVSKLGYRIMELSDRIKNILERNK